MFFSRCKRKNTYYILNGIDGGWPGILKRIESLLFLNNIPLKLLKMKIYRVRLFFVPFSWISPKCFVEHYWRIGMYRKCRIIAYCFTSNYGTFLTMLSNSSRAEECWGAGQGWNNTSQFYVPWLMHADLYLYSHHVHKFLFHSRVRPVV